MAEFYVGNNASRLSLRMYAQLPGDEIQDGDVINFADAESVSLEFAQDLLRMICGIDVTMINQSDNIKTIFEAAKKANSEYEKLFNYLL
jgi:hypothetical protein